MPPANRALTPMHYTDPDDSPLVEVDDLYDSDLSTFELRRLQREQSRSDRSVSWRSLTYDIDAQDD